MKMLKFKEKLVEKILDGRKTITWRLFDDKDLRAGDQLRLINSDNGVVFGGAEIIDIREKKIKDLNDDELVANDYNDRNQILEVNKKYYGDQVTDETIIKIIEFKLV